jgi:superfamily II DNA or RNA helicase
LISFTFYGLLVPVKQFLSRARMKVSLRNYQETAVTSLRMEYMRGRTSVLFVLPTGGGKTVCFSYITERAAVLGNRVCILVHRQELVDQTSRTLTEIGVDHGVIAAGYRQDLSRGVQVASVQTLARRLHTVPRGFFQLLVIDEAHHAVAGSWAKVIDHYCTAKILGVTATPERLDGRGLKDKFDAMVLGPDAAWLEAHGYLAPARYFIPPGLGIDWGSLKHRGGDIDERDAARAIMATAQAIAGPVTQYQAHLANTTAIAFCCTVEHAQLVARGFNEAGIPAAVLDGTLDRLTRRRRIQQLASGELKVLTSCQVISEGTDVPSVGGCLLLRPTDSISLYLQQVGRCLRPAPGKRHAVILDMVGNVAKHGFHTDPRDWALDGRKKRKASDAPPIRECPGCYAALPAATRVCPECGHEFTPEAQDHGAEQLGTALLVEVTEEEKRRIAAEKRREVGKARSLEELEAIAAQRGYKPGWARYVWQSRQARRPRAFG